MIREEPLKIQRSSGPPSISSDEYYSAAQHCLPGFCKAGSDTKAGAFFPSIDIPGTSLYSCQRFAGIVQGLRSCGLNVKKNTIQYFTGGVYTRQTYTPHTTRGLIAPRRLDIYEGRLLFCALAEGWERLLPRRKPPRSSLSVRKPNMKSPLTLSAQARAVFVFTRSE